MPVSCSGLHTVITGKDASTSDAFTCKSTTGKPLTNAKPFELITLKSLASQGIGAWGSDYNGAVAKTFNGMVSFNDMSYSAVATY